jgi:hypothetical protein
MSAIFGFSSTLASAKKKDPEFFNKGLIPHVGSKGAHEAGAALALRALGWGSLYAITGCGVLFYTIWKFLGVNDVSTDKLSFILVHIYASSNTL